MWQRHDNGVKLCRAEAAHHSACVLAVAPFDNPAGRMLLTPVCLNFVLRACHGDDVLRRQDFSSLGDLLRDSKAVKCTVEDICAGMLEFQISHVEEVLDEVAEDSIPLPSSEFLSGEVRYSLTKAYAQFTHRSALDFLIETEAGRRILSAETPVVPEKTLRTKRDVLFNSLLSAALHGIEKFSVFEVVFDYFAFNEDLRSFGVNILIFQKVFDEMQRCLIDPTMWARTPEFRWKQFSLQLHKAYAESTAKNGLLEVIKEYFRQAEIGGRSITTEFKNFLLISVVRRLEGLKYSRPDRLCQVLRFVLSEGANANELVPSSNMYSKVTYHLHNKSAYTGFAHGHATFTAFASCFGRYLRACVRWNKNRSKANIDWIRQTVDEFIKNGADLSSVWIEYNMRPSDSRSTRHKYERVIEQNCASMLRDLGIETLNPIMKVLFVRDRFGSKYWRIIPPQHKIQDLFRLDSKNLASGSVFHQFFEGNQNITNEFNIDEVIEHLRQRDHKIERERDVLQLEGVIPSPFKGHEKLFPPEPKGVDNEPEVLR